MMKKKQSYKSKSGNRVPQTFESKKGRIPEHYTFRNKGK